MNSARPYKQVLDFLTENIEQFNNEPNHKLPSERMLAVKFNASRRSIRLAYDRLIEKKLVVKIHGKGHFTTGYKDSDSSRHEISTKEIYLIIPALRSEFTHDILVGISDFCEEHSLELSLKISKGQLEIESKYINMALKSNAKGIILFPSDNELRNTEIVNLSERRYPLTIIDRYFKNINASFVSTDNQAAMHDAIKFLYSKKIKSFAYITAPLSLATTIEERLNGFKSGVLEYYGKNPNDSILEIKDFAPPIIYKQFEQYLETHPLPEVIITPGVQHIVDSLIVVLSRNNISPTKDVKLMLFDNDLPYDALAQLKPFVIKQRAYAIGYESSALLYNQIYGDLRTESKRFPADIIDYSNKDKIIHFFSSNRKS